MSILFIPINLIKENFLSGKQQNMQESLFRPASIIELKNVKWMKRAHARTHTSWYSYNINAIQSSFMKVCPNIMVSVKIQQDPSE